MNNSKESEPEQKSKGLSNQLSGFLVARTFNGRWRTKNVIKRTLAATLLLAVDLYSKQEVTLKAECENEEDQRLLKEIDLYKRLHSCSGKEEKMSIPELYDYGTDHCHIFAVFQLLGPSLRDVLRFSPGVISEDVVLAIGDQILLALKCLHMNGIVHGSVSIDNIVLGVGDHERIAYLVDYGNSSTFSMETLRRNCDRSNKSPREDVLLLGCWLYDLLHGSNRCFKKAPKTRICQSKNLEDSTISRNNLRDTVLKFILECRKTEESVILPDYDYLSAMLRNAAWNRAQSNECRNE